MSLFDMLEAILLGPLKIIFEVIFSFAWDITGHPGSAIIVLSLCMNVILLPLYRRADAIQEAARDKENEMRDTVAHIKATFSGDERMMILQAYYRENHYNPLSVLSGMLSLLLEIPFFMAAYQFLNSVGAFQGLAFGPISDLGAPDGLLTIGGFSINLLPVIMTVINVVSSSLFLKGFPLKTKVQLYGMALFFLIFLYNAPAALVFYWTLNNTFSLFKTLYYKLPNNKKILTWVMAIGGAALVFFSTIRRQDESALIVRIGLAMQLPWVMPLLGRFRRPKSIRPTKQAATKKSGTALFLSGGLFLSLLIGLLIPSTYISAGVQEYIDPHYFYNPAWYVVQTLCLSIGLFLVWLGVFYWLASPKVKRIFSRTIWILSCIMLVNYMFFGTKLGIVTPNLQYTDTFAFSLAETLINIATILLLVIGGIFITGKFSRAAASVLMIASITLSYMGILNMNTIVETAAETKQQIENSSDRLPSFTMSKNGNNVVVIMLDRGIGLFVPYIFEEKPELLEQFDGFTNYTNTLSYGCSTNFTTPSLFGGYEYTPENLNLRDSEALPDKHNEALKVLPAIFSAENYKVTTIDPPYAGYKWIPDISIYDDMAGVNAYLAEGKFNDYQSRIQNITARKRNFFYFSLMKTLPVQMQSGMYDKGAYLSLPTMEVSYNNGNWGFMSAYNVMKNLSTMTSVSSGSEDTLMMIRTNITHEPAVLQEPDYEPSSVVSNNYPNGVKTISDGTDTRPLSDDPNDVVPLSHYHANVKALMLLGEWFDFLRENDLYDNTRIIIASDHSQTLATFDTSTGTDWDIGMYLPILIVKDFDAEGFTSSDKFMTNADVPTIATRNLISQPVNPFTGVPIDDSQKTENQKQNVFLSSVYNIDVNNGNQFLPGAWATVSGNVSNPENWEIFPESTVLPPDTTP